MVPCVRLLFGFALAACGLAPASLAGAIAHADGGVEPYAVGLDTPRVITPQWVGEPGVEAVVILGIDDLNNNPEKYEAYLRPILDRLKRIDGRAPVSIFTCNANLKHFAIQKLLDEGVNLEVHTKSHPCPLLAGGDLSKVRAEVHDCITALCSHPVHRPVAFRMPCCDSQNTPSPRFFSEVQHLPTEQGRFLPIDSSVFCVLTAADPSLPRELVLDADGHERFRKYIPFPNFANTIENHPYPYVIGGKTWEFPCIVPSDWQAQNIRGKNHPDTVADMKAALDAVVLKQGVFCLVFHPHGWIENTQVVDLIDHAVARHGSRIKFLNFAEAYERLNTNLLAGNPLRVSDGRRGLESSRRGAAPAGEGSPARLPGSDNGVRVLDVNADGFQDVIIANATQCETRVWDPMSRSWRTTGFPAPLVEAGLHEGLNGVFRAEDFRFTVLPPDGQAALLRLRAGALAGWRYSGAEWVEDPGLVRGLEPLFAESKPIERGRDRGFRLRDLDGDGTPELIVGNLDRTAVFIRDAAEDRWTPAPYSLPAGLRIVGMNAVYEGREHSGPEDDTGLRFLDLDHDGRLDILYSNPLQYGVYLFTSAEKGWSRIALERNRGEADPSLGQPEIPPIVRGIDQHSNIHSNNGFWPHSGRLFWVNEDTDKLPDHAAIREVAVLLKDLPITPRTPAREQAGFHVRAGFRVELAAAEPLVADPIALEWDEKGRLWVVEMGDYPLGADGRGKPGGRIKILEDLDHDGTYDRAATFLDGIEFPTGVFPWRDGVLIAAAPEIFFAADRDGDGKAEVREVILTGLARANPQHRTSGFEFGLDGWIHAANGTSDGGIRSLKTGVRLSANHRDYRFDPDTGRLEPESGESQYGRRQDDAGRWFGNDNSTWARHYVISDRDLARNPSYAAEQGTGFVCEPNRKLYPKSPIFARFNDPDNAGVATSACSPTPYRDNLFGPGFERALFVSEPVHNVVHRLNLVPEGASVRGVRPPDEQDREFLASSDPMFRPSGLRIGPDGALWIADMYRAVIEHPEWIPDDWEARIDLRLGSDLGRIWRICPIDKPARPFPHLASLTPVELAAAIDSPSAWQRGTAQRLLLHHHRARRPGAEPGQPVAPEVIRTLESLVNQSASSAVRIHALATLGSLNSVAEEQLIRALDDQDPSVRAHAVCVARTLPDWSSAALAAIIQRGEDHDPAVRLQVALALGDRTEAAAGRTLARIAQRGGADPWIRMAVLSSAQPHLASLLENLAASPDPDSRLLDPLVRMLGAGDAGKAVADLWSKLTSLPDGKRFAAWQLALAAGLSEAASRRDQSLKDLIQEAAPEQARHYTATWEQLAVTARERLVDADSAETDRRAAARLLGWIPDPVNRESLASQLGPQVPIGLQREALSALVRQGDPAVATLLLERWRGLSPAIRASAFERLIERPEWARAVVAAIESGTLQPSQLDLNQRSRLIDHRDAAIRAAAANVLDRAGGTDRAAVLDRFRAILRQSRTSDITTGAALFRTHCGTCHRYQGEGGVVGPDLNGLSDRSTETLLAAILDPNRAIEARYQAFVLELKDGRTLQGVIASETSASLILRDSQGAETAVLRSDIIDLAGTGQSLMPVGLEEQVGEQGMVDIVAYLQNFEQPRKVFSGNEPVRVAPDPAGVIRLTASNAEIRGPSLVFETAHQNLGYWSSAQDRARWELVVNTPGRHELWVEYACPHDTAGNRAWFEVGPERLEVRVEGTGTWEDYRRVKIGQVELREGLQMIQVHSAGPIQNGALFDLRSIELRPVAAQPAASASQRSR
jgi:putative membrane-bound dehydrogenase-like protein